MNAPIPLWQRKVAARAREHSRALAAPMPNTPWCGDPRIVTSAGAESADPVERLLCLYAAAVLIKRGALPADASKFDARVIDGTTAVFVRADASQVEVCRLTVECSPA